MFNALARKEWRQLRTLRRVGIGIGVALPPFVLVVAEVSSRGWLASGVIDSYSKESLLLELLPHFLLGLWVLLTLLVVGETFAGDRAAGTEAFLLERPVRRSLVWRSRIAASLATILVMLGVQLLVWWLFARSGAEPGAAEWVDARGLLFLAGPAAVALAYLSGMAAASFAVSPVQAVLLSIVLGIVPAGMAALLVGMFPMAHYGGVWVGSVVPWVLVVGYVAGSFRMQCRGEPAGRGRIARGLICIAIAAGLVPGLFAVSTPLVLRSEVTRSVLRVVPSPAGDRAVVMAGGGGGWLIDLERGEKVQFFPPPIHDVRFTPDGRRLVLFHSAAPFGGLSINGRADVLDTDGAIQQSVFGRRNLMLAGRPLWAGDHLVARTFLAGRNSGLIIGSAVTGETRELDLDLVGGDWTLLGPIDRGEVFVFRRLAEAAIPTSVLQRIDLENGRLEPEPVWKGPEEEIPHYYYRAGLSPSGRYLGFRGHTVVVDLADGGERRVSGRVGTWLFDDRRAEVMVEGRRSSLQVGAIGELQPVRSWESRTLLLLPSPDRKRLLVQVLASEGGEIVDPSLGQLAKKGGTLEELWIYEVGSGTWTAARSWFGPLPIGYPTGIDWAGPEELAHSEVGSLRIRGITEGDAFRFVIGG